MAAAPDHLACRRNVARHRAGDTSMPSPALVPARHNPNTVRVTDVQTSLSNKIGIQVEVRKKTNTQLTSCRSNDKNAFWPYSYAME